MRFLIKTHIFISVQLIVFTICFSFQSIAILNLKTTQTLSSESDIDSALLYYYDKDKLHKYYFVADSIRKTHHEGTNWKFSVSKAWLLINDQKYDSSRIVIDQEIEPNKKDPIINDELLRLFHLATLNRILLGFSDAEYFYQQLKEIAVKNNRTDYLYISYWGLYKNAEAMKDFDLARQYLDDLMTQLDNNFIVNNFKTYQFYAHNSIKRNDFELGRLYLKKCIKIYEEFPDSINNAEHELSWIYNQLGQICNTLKKDEECIDFYKKSIELSKKIEYHIITSDSYANLGVYYLLRNNYAEAIDAFNKTIYFADKIGDNKIKMTSYYYLSIINDSIKDYQKAYRFHKLYTQFADSLGRNKYRELYINERTKFETAEKEKELKVLNANIQSNRIILIASVSAFILFIIIIILIYRQFKLKSQQKLNSLEKRIAQEKQEYLLKQMNPHFLFNTLNSIQYFMFRNDKIATNEYMSKFAMLLRKTLENSEKEFIAIKDEIETLHLYIELEQLRFKNKFAFSFDIDENIDTIQQKIPPMIIHPFVENAINHGLQFVENDGKLTITISQSAHQAIICTIEDNGIGRKKSEEIKNIKNKNHQSLGTSITSERLKILKTNKSDKLEVTFIDLEDEYKKPMGTKVIVTIPYTL